MQASSFIQVTVWPHMLSHPAREHWEARPAGEFSFASYTKCLLPLRLWGVAWVFKGDLSIIGHNIQALSHCLWLQCTHSDLVFLSKKHSSKPLSQTWTNCMFLCCDNLIKLLEHTAWALQSWWEHTSCWLWWLDKFLGVKLISPIVGDPRQPKLLALVL